MTGLVDALVVGGGPAGSATAALLARRGCRVVLIDRARFPRAKPCGDYLNPGCDEVLGRLGARDAVARVAAPICGMRLVTPEGFAVGLPFPRRTGWALSRAQLDQTLLDYAGRTGVDVRDGTGLVSLESEAGSAGIWLERGGRRDRCRARIVIGADGLRSAVARAADLGAVARRGHYTVGAYIGGLDPASDDPPVDCTGAPGSETGAARWG